MADPKTVKVKSEHESQGPFVVINEEDFNPDVHVKYDPEADETDAAAWEAKAAAEKAAKEQAEADAAAAAKVAADKAAKKAGK